MKKYVVGNDLRLSPSKLWAIDEDFCNQYKDHVNGKFFWNVPNQESVTKAEQRLDEKRSWPQTDMCKQLALEYVDKILEVPLTHVMWTHEKVIEHTDLTKGAGPPLIWEGIATRIDFINSEVFQSKLGDKERLYEYIMSFDTMTRNCAKEEWASIEDLVTNKSRTFNMPGFNCLYAQHLCYGQGNENLKEYVWSKYGFNPFKSGVRKMEDRLLKKNKYGKRKYPILFDWDARGYDRKLDLRNVANRRYRYFCVRNVNEFDRALAHWVSQGMKASIMIMTNGDVVIRIRGNNSGSGMTTANNIEAGFEILTDVMIAAYYESYKKFPTFEKVYSQPVFLYGDDNLAGCSKKFAKILDETWLRDRLMVMHSIDLKEFHGGWEYPLDKMTFLGFKFGYERMYVTPKWNPDRLLLPIMYSRGSEDDVQFLGKMYSILLLSYGHKRLFEELRKVYILVLSYYAQPLPGHGHPTVKAIVRNGGPSNESMGAFYFGLEGGGPKIDMTTKLTILYPTLTQVEGGGYKCESTIMGDVFEHIVTNNADPMIAYSAMFTRFGELIAAAWPPPVLEKVKSTIEDEVKKLDIKVSETDRLRLVHCIHTQLWKSIPYGRTVDTSKTPKPGSYNPYGNQNGDRAMWEKELNEEGKSIYKYLDAILPPPGVNSLDDQQKNSLIDDIQKGCWENQRDIEVQNRNLKIEKKLPPVERQGVYNQYGNEMIYRFLKERFQGSFNPYGNGQKISKKKFIARRIKQGMTLAQAEAAWKRGPPKQRVNKPSVPKASYGQWGKEDRSQNRQNRAVINMGRSTPYMQPITQGAKNKMSQNAVVKNVFPECTARYLLALCDPFYPMEQQTKATAWFTKKYGEIDASMLPCIPTFPPVSSHKTTGVFRGEIATGVNGVGYVAIAPKRLASDYAGNRSDLCPIIGSTSANVLTNAFGTLDTNAALVNAVASNWTTRFAVSDLVNGSPSNRGTKYRLVSCGLRVKYAGAPMTMKGIVHAVQMPAHESLGAIGMADLQTIPSCVTYDVSKEWLLLSFVPTMPEEYEYNTDITTNFHKTEGDLHSMGFLFLGCEPSVLITVEALACFEVTGPNVVGKTKTQVDLNGVSVVSSTVSPDSIKAVQDSPSYLERIAESTVQTVTELIPKMAGVGATLAFQKLAGFTMPHTGRIMN
jgi:hypothetical protein